jgi:hypothetical protein
MAWKTADLPNASGASFAFADFQRLTLSPGEQAWLFGAFALAFAGTDFFAAIAPSERALT